MYWGKPKPSPDELDQARQRPHSYIYRWAGQFSAYEVTPPDAVLGCWQVDGSGKITGRFMPNAGFNPRKYPIE